MFSPYSLSIWSCETRVSASVSEVAPPRVANHNRTPLDFRISGLVAIVLSSSCWRMAL